MTEHADAAGVIAAALPGEPEKVIAVLEGLMSHGLLRESPADFTGLPEGAVLLHDLRIIEYLDAVSRPSQACTRPPSQCSRKAPPPMPLLCGSTRVSTICTATAASTAAVSSSSVADGGR